MKINWGTGILIGIVLFISFIMFFVIKMSTNDKYSYDLVVEEYYKQELAFQEEIDAEENLKALSSKIKGQKTGDGWLLSFPTEMEESVVSGTIEFYRPSNKKLDFQRPLEIENNVLLIPDENLVGGRWDISIRWKSKTKDFLYKDKIIY